MITAMQELNTTSTGEVNWDDILPRLMLYSLRLIRSRHLEERISAEDVAQIAIERAMRHGGPVKDYRNYLLSVAKHIVADETRKKLREEAQSAESDRSIKADSDMQLDLEGEERRKAITEALDEAARGEDKLAELTTALLEDSSLTTKEIAARLGVTVHEVYRLKKRLYQRVRKAIAY